MKKDKKDTSQEKINSKPDAEINEGIKSQDENENSDEKDERIVQLEKEAAELKDRLLRKAAEFENYKRRNENDQLNLLKYAAESLILKLLPIVDDFERSLDHIESSNDIESLKQGIKLIYDKFMKVLDEQGVKKIESVGQPFNVDYHEALMQRKSDEVPPHTVLDEVEKGYIYKDRVIRHAKVIVSEDTGEHTAEPEDSDNENSEE
ncbi:MAG TPA: nucleotide exchange factor GrpE [Ignavibacteriaceae bacterium]|nr:nucleotide exchange factor GrpE [Ignavibacteriaceae bacterium]